MSSSFIGLSPNPINHYNFIQWFPVQNLTLPLSEPIPLPTLNHSQQQSFSYSELPKLSDRKFSLRTYPVPFVRNEQYTFYINSTDPFDDSLLDFADLRLAVLQGTEISQDTTTPLEKDVIDPDNYRILIRNFAINSLPQKGFARLLLYTDSDQVVRYASNCIEIYEENECSLTAILQYSSSVDEYRFNYRTGSITNWTNKLRIHVVSRGVSFEGNQEIYKSVNTGSSRMSAPEGDKLRELETQFFDENAHDAFQVALLHADHGTFFLNNKAYLPQGQYSPNSLPDFPLTKGTVNAIEQDFSVDRRGGKYEAPPLFFLTSRTISAGNITLDLDNKTIDEGQPVHTKVGDFLWTGAVLPIIIDLEPGPGDDDNNSFRVCPNCSTLQLQSLEVFDASVKDTYTIRVGITDSRGFTAVSVFIISVNDLTTPITDIVLDNNTIEENEPIGTYIGSFSTADGTEPYAYTLVQGSPQFYIIGENLYSKVTFDYETRQSYTISVRSTDSLGETFIKSFVINIIDVDESVIFDISLDNTSISEGIPPQPFANIIGTGGQLPYTYELIDDGSGDVDSFEIQGGSVIASTEVFNFSTKSQYTFIIELTDALARTYQEGFTINIIDTGVDVSDITLQGQSIQENKAIGTLIGRFFAVGGIGPYTWTLTAGQLDNNSFSLGLTPSDANELKSGAVYDYETKTEYRIRITVTDSQGQSLSKDFTIFILDVPEVNNITLDKNHICEDMPSGSVVGSFNSFGGLTPYVYTLVSGTGSTDNASFTISGNQLLTNIALDYTTKSDYSIRVRSTDNGGAFFEKVFVIYVNEVVIFPVTTDLEIQNFNGVISKNLLAPTIGIIHNNTPENNTTELEAWLKFDNTGYTDASVIDARLEVDMKHELGLGGEFQYAIEYTTSNWTAATITYDNRPAALGSAGFAFFPSDANPSAPYLVPASIDVTPGVQAKIADSDISFVIRCTTFPSSPFSGNFLVILSQENDDSRPGPQLKVCIYNPDNPGDEEDDSVFNNVFNEVFA